MGMTPDPEPRVIRQTYEFRSGTLITPDGREYPLKGVTVETTVREYRANNGEVCKQEPIFERVFAHGPDKQTTNVHGDDEGSR